MNNSEQLATPAERAALRQYVLDLRDHYEAYHGRRENVAWAAVTVYLAAMVVFPREINIYIPDWFTRTSVSLLIFLTWYFVMHFVRSQFRSRRVAANFVQACGEVLTIVADENTQISSADCKPRIIGMEGNQYSCPALVASKVEQHQNRVATVKIPPRWNELSLLGVMTVWTNASAIFALCWPEHCDDDWRLWLVVGCSAIVLSWLVLWHTGYREVVADEWERSRRP